MFAFRTEMIQIFDNPLSDTFLMEDMSTRQQDRLFHVFVTNSAGKIMELIQLLSFYLFEISHSLW